MKKEPVDRKTSGGREKGRGGDRRAKSNGKNRGEGRGESCVRGGSNTM